MRNDTSTPAEACEHEPKVGRGQCRRCYSRNYYHRNAEYKERQKAMKREQYAEDPTKVLERGRAHYAANREEHIARRINWRLTNPERQYETSTAWRRNNLDRAAVASHRRRALANEAQGTFTVEEWRAVLEEFDSRCAYCQVPSDSLVMEHMTPLSRGGSNDIKNIVPSCATCNSRKGTKTIFEFLTMKNPLTIGAHRHVQNTV